MTADVLSGRPPARQLRKSVAAEVEQFNHPLKLAVVVNPESSAAMSYARQVGRGAGRVGIQSRIETIDRRSTTESVTVLVRSLAIDPAVHGIILSLPLPDQVAVEPVASAIPSEKDVDRISANSIGSLFSGVSTRAPGVAMAVIRLLAHYQVPLAGQRATVVGRSLSVGKPVALLMLGEDATVTICHARTTHLDHITAQADVLVSGVGQAGLITERHVKPGATVIDVGTSYSSGSVVGDVEASAVESVASAYSPVPGGVGPLTVYCILDNLLSLVRSSGRV